MCFASVTAANIRAAGQYLTFQGYEYKYVNAQADWSTARAACVAEGGDLASIHTRAENEFVYDLFPTPSTSRWIGAYLNRTSSPQTAPFKWLWSDGSPFNIFTIRSNQYNPTKTCVRDSHPASCLFSVNEPNDFLGYGPDCIRMGLTPTSGNTKALAYEWNDGACKELASSVCKRPAPGSYA